MRGSYLEAAADLGARPWTAFRTVVLPVLAPGGRGRLGVHVLADLGDYITVQLVGGTGQMLGNLVYPNFSTDLPFAAAVARAAAAGDGGLPADDPAHGALDRL